MTLYQITYERVGRHGSQRPDSPPAPAPYRLQARDADELALEVHRDVRRYLGSRYTEVLVNLEEMRGVVLAGGVQPAGSFTIAIVDEPAPTANPTEQLKAVAELEPSTLPAVTKAGRGYLARFAAETVRVYRDFAKPGNGVSRPVLDRLLNDGLVELGDHDPQQGRPVIVTWLGRDVLAQHEQEG